MNHRTSVEDIKRINNLSSTHICVGQHLYIARPGLFASILRNPRDFMSLNGVGGPDISEQALKGIAQRSNGVVPRKNAPPRSSAVVSRNVRKPKALPLHQTFSSAIGNIIRRNRFSFPLEERIVSSGYGMRWGRLHQGVDFAAETGTHICAAAHGKVSYAGYDGPGYGNLVEVSHSDGFVTRYAHCHDILVQLGQDIVAGETIGTVGETGRASGPHLHFEIRQNDKSIDPLQLLR